MGVMTFRSRFEGVRFAGDTAATQEAAEMIAGVTDWLSDAGLSSSLIDAEADLLKLRPNSWEREALVAIGEAMLPESIGVLFAGLNLVSEVPRTTAPPTPSRCCGCSRFCPIRRSSPARGCPRARSGRRWQPG